MPIYVYGCDAQPREHPRKEVTHGMNENPSIKCDECGATMHRVPQAHRFYMHPEGILTEWMEENYVRSRTNQPRFSPDTVKKPGSGIPQKDFDTRKYKEIKL